MLIVWPGVIKRQTTGGSLLLVTPTTGVLGDPDPFLRSGFGDTLDQLTGQKIKGISILVERLYTG